MKITNKQLISISNEDIVDGKFTNKEVTSVADGCFNEMPQLRAVSLPKVKKIGNHCFSNNQALTSISLPALTTTGSYCFRYNQALTSISLPALTTTGSYCFSNNQALTSISLPALTTTGEDCFRYNQALTSIKIVDNNYVINDYQIKDVDGYPFVIISERTSKGFKIYTGYTFLRIYKEVVQKEPGYVAEKDGYTAHGETVKKAISDVQFKIVSERLRNEPINEDTVINIERYRMITGACEQGVKMWMDQNNITDEKIIARDLLPLLKATNAYGYEKFLQLVTFNQ